MKKTISKLQYITQKTENLNHVQAAKQACEAGCDWVQLRLKGKTEVEVQAIAQEVKAICVSHKVTFIMNDYVAVAKAVKADGVHLGKNDMSPAEARKILGEDVIIGGTANTFADVQRLVSAGVDYIGAGPFKFTTTKKNLDLLFGTEGYMAMMENCKKHQIEIPIVAIGGIVAHDMEAIMQTGVYGVAVSGVITHHANPAQIVDELYTALNVSI